MLDLEAIRRRAEEFNRCYVAIHGTTEDVADDVLALVAEVERLREEEDKGGDWVLVRDADKVKAERDSLLAELEATRKVVDEARGYQNTSIVGCKLADLIAAYDAIARGKT